MATACAAKNPPVKTTNPAMTTASEPHTVAAAPTAVNASDMSRQRILPYRATNLPAVADDTDPIA